MKKKTYAVLLQNAQTMDHWNMTEEIITVGRKHDIVEVFQVFSDSVFIGVKDWEFEVIVKPQNIVIMDNNRFENEKWLVDYEQDVDQGTVDDLKTGKRYHFSTSVGLPARVPAYIRNIAKVMIKGVQL
jgi:hypothetical protein